MSKNYWSERFVPNVRKQFTKSGFVAKTFGFVIVMHPIIGVILSLYLIWFDHLGLFPNFNIYALVGIFFFIIESLIWFDYLEYKGWLK